MISDLVIYLSMSPELDPEREALSQVLARAPVPVGWRIVHTPPPGTRVELATLQKSQLRLLVLGSDIRAPMGYEWYLAMRNGPRPVLFRKTSTLRTPAALAFIRMAQEHSIWRDYRDALDLSVQVEKILAGHFLGHVSAYELQPAEVARIQEWKSEIEQRAGGPLDLETRRALGEDGVIFSRERYLPSQGILIQPPKDRPDQNAS